MINIKNSKKRNLMEGRGGRRGEGPQQARKGGKQGKKRHGSKDTIQERKNNSNKSKNPDENEKIKMGTFLPSSSRSMQETRFGEEGMEGRGGEEGLAAREGGGCCAAASEKLYKSRQRPEPIQSLIPINFLQIPYPAATDGWPRAHT